MKKEIKEDTLNEKELLKKERKEEEMELERQRKELKRLHEEMLKKEEEHRKEEHIAPNDSYIILKNINKVYDNHIQAVFDFNLDIKKHELIVLVGPSGCGKSTTLRMIAGLEEITTGDLFIDGVYSNEKTAKERDVSMVFQNYALYPHMTVYDNMAFGLRIRNYEKEKIDEAVHKAAKILQIEDYLTRRPKELSGGQRQRVALGRAIVRDAKVFLMDEPLSNLDAKLRVSMRSEIIRLHQELNATTIYVTHDQTEAMTMASRIVVMKDCYIQQIGVPEEIYNHPVNTFVATFIGAPAMNLIEATYSDNYIIFDDGFKIKLADSFDKTYKEFINNQIAILKKQIEDKDYEKPDMNILLTMHKEKFSLKNLFKGKKEHIKIEKPEEKLKKIEDTIKEYESHLSNSHHIIFGIRPEDICANFEETNIKNKSNTLNLIANVSELLGSEYFVHMNFQNIDLIAKFDANTKINQGSELNIYFNLDKVHLFDVISKKAIN